MKNASNSSLVLLSAIWLSVSAPANVQAQSAAATTKVPNKPPLSSCTLESKQAPPVFAQCGTLQVPENPEAPDGRKISLKFAIVPAKGQSESDPIVMIAGGPGQSALETYPAVHPALSTLNTSRAIVLLDQRGTGQSQPLICSEINDLMEKLGTVYGEAARAEALQQAKLATAACAKRLGEKVDLRYYGTREAVYDLEQLRLALSLPAWNLYGISYGTRVAQQYAKAYPKSVRTLALDGVAPNDWAVGDKGVETSVANLRAIFKRCQQIPACEKAHGDLNEKLSSFLAKLEIAPEKVSFLDASTGEPRSDEITTDGLRGMLHLYSYAPETTAILPFLIAQAVSGKPQALMAQMRNVEEFTSAFPVGMRLSVLCTEDIGFLSANNTSPAESDPLLREDTMEAFKAQCENWPTRARADDFAKPLSTDIPTLIFSGEFDPVTPAAHGERILKSLSNAKHLVFTGRGHNVMPSGCGPRLYGEFVSSAEPKTLKTECLEQLKALPPFVASYGWEP